MRIERWDISKDGPLSEAALRSKIEKRGYTVTRYEYPPGTYFSGHTHATDKIDAVLSGNFKMTLAGKEAVLGPGDLLTVPAGIVHIAEVVGEVPVVSLDAVPEE